MATIRSTRSSVRLSAVPKPESPAAATSPKKRALRGTTPRASTETPRSKPKAAAKAELPPELESTPVEDEEDEDEAPLGAYFTNCEIFSTPTISRDKYPFIRSRTRFSRPIKPIPQPAESPLLADLSQPADLPQPVKSSQSTELSHPVDSLQPVDSLLSSPSKATGTKNAVHPAETQELYDKIARNGQIVRTQGVQALYEASRADITAQDTAQEEHNDLQDRVQEQNNTFPAPDSAPVPALEAETPKRSTWAWSFTPFKSVINYFTPAKTPPQTRQPSVQPPATAPPAVVLAPEEEQEFRSALTPIPQARRRASQAVRPKSKKRTTNSAVKKAKPKRVPDNHIISRALESIDPEHHHKARAWVEQTALKLAEETPGKPGEKRKRFESGLTVADIEEIPAHYPWEQAGTYGLLDDFDDSDDEAPAWYILDQLANNRPIKRRKATHGSVMDEDMPSLNDIDNRRASFASHGNTAQMKDLHPLSALGTSPYQTKETPLKENIDPMQQKTTKSSSGSFTVPDSDSDDDDDDLEQMDYATHTNGDTSWLKRSSQQAGPLQPPPPPTPAHATLPSPIKASPVVPPIQRENSPIHEDPVKIQRARAMKFTPAKPSRLREAMLPSPSLLSEIGNDSVIAVDRSDVTIGSYDAEMPDAIPLSLDKDVYEYVSKFVQSDTFKRNYASAWGGSEVIWRHDEDEP